MKPDVEALVMARLVTATDAMDVERGDAHPMSLWIRSGLPGYQTPDLAYSTTATHIEVRRPEEGRLTWGDLVRFIRGGVTREWVDQYMGADADDKAGVLDELRGRCARAWVPQPSLFDVEGDG